MYIIKKIYVYECVNKFYLTLCPFQLFVFLQKFKNKINQIYTIDFKIYRMLKINFIRYLIDE